MYEYRATHPDPKLKRDPKVPLILLYVAGNTLEGVNHAH